MNEHLSRDQVLEWLMGARTPEWEAHVRTCGECAKGIESVAGPLRLFSAAVNDLSSGVRVSMKNGEPRNYWRLAYWPVVVVAAVLLIFAALPKHRDRPQPLPADPSISDEALLQHVEYEVGESVPGPMEPLARLMNQESDTGRSR